MKINYLNLQAFGHFTDYHVFFDENKNFHLLYGPNEAGKSTILRSISNYLYGFPRQTTDAFLHSNSKLRIEGELQKENGEKLQFTRRKGTKNTVLDVNNNPLDEKMVASFLNGISEQQFTNMFALDHVRLREGGESLLQSDGNVSQSLFSAASGINALRNVLEELESRTGNLYGKNKSKTAINSALKEEKDLTKKITENQLKIQDWKDLERKFLEGKKEIEKLKEDIKQLTKEENKYKRLKQTLPKIALRKELLEKYTELATVPDLPEGMEELRKENSQKLEAAKAAKKNAEEELQKTVRLLQNIIIPDGILEQKTLIESLYRDSSSYQKDVKQLPVLKGKYRQLEQTIFAKLKELGRETVNIDIVEQYRVNAELKKTIRELAEQKPVLEAGEKNAREEYESLEKERKNSQFEFQQLNEVVNLGDLESVIDKAKAEGNLDRILNEKQTELHQIEHQISELIRNLPLFDGTTDELLQLKVPNLKETVKKFQKQYEEIYHDIQQLHQKIGDENASIEKYEKRIRELESLTDIPTISELDGARSHRDTGWLVIRQKLNKGDVDQTVLAQFSNGLPIDMAFEKSIQKTDEIADKLRTEAEKVGEKNKLLADIEAGKNKVQTLTSELECANEKMDVWNKQWKEHWQSAKIQPLTPDEMLEWLDKYNTILELNHKKQITLTQLKDIKDKQTNLFILLKNTLTVLGTSTEFSTLEDLVHFAEQTRKRLTDEKNKRDHLQETLKNVTGKLDLASDKKNRAAENLKNWQVNWEKAIEKLGIAKETSPNVVKELLETFEACVQHYDELKQTEKEINAIEERISAFETSVKSMEQNVLTNLVPHAMDLAVLDLFKVLQQAQQDQVDIANLNKQITQANEKIKAAELQMTEANSALEKLLKQAGCDSIDELEKIESAFKQKCDIQGRIQLIEEQLIELGNGRMLEELLEEAELANKDTLDMELEDIQKQLYALDQTRSEIEQAHGVVKNEYLEKIEGASFESVKAAEEKQSKLAAIANYTEEYVTYKLASILLQKGIEFYRESNQSPILNRASEIFRRLTLGSFDGITVEYDKKDQPVIMGVRNQDEMVEVSGMSDGTTDQLYLSLRVASMEHYLRENEPIPFIVDDILVHFDDERSKETLKVLLELSTQTQIIFFTHHYRNIELMKAITADNAYQLTELNTVTV
ncbi:AAA family ATPase [Bacillus sp. APMAM]|nr:AAA family ATPase [Bacillus sp. APMAM]RTZ53538.1 nucleoside triphosphate hydrolase [Bacillus sp. SAJ1]